jgi:isochorismate hydrolase
LSGKREEIPSDCPKEYRELIEKCWAHDLKQRPSSDEIVTQLEQMWNPLNIDRKESVSSI